MGWDSHRDPEAWCSRTTTKPRPGVPGRGDCRPKFPTRLSTGWHRRRLILPSNTPVAVLAAPVLFLIGRPAREYSVSPPCHLTWCCLLATRRTGPHPGMSEAASPGADGNPQAGHRSLTTWYCWRKIGLGAGRMIAWDRGCVLICDGPGTSAGIAGAHRLEWWQY